MTLAVIALLFALDGSSISVALPVSIGLDEEPQQRWGLSMLQITAEKLNGTAIEAFWCGTSFLLCSTGNGGGRAICF